MKPLIGILLLVFVPLAHAFDLDKRGTFIVNDSTIAEATNLVLDTAYGPQKTQLKITIEPTGLVLENRATKFPLPVEFKNKIGEFVSERSSPLRIHFSVRDFPVRLALDLIAQQASCSISVKADEVIYHSLPQKVIIDSFENEFPEALVEKALSLMYPTGSDHAPASFNGKLLYYSGNKRLYVIGTIEAWSLLKSADQGEL
jgi:hypothetical protein